jgi:hypothetical protein
MPALMVVLELEVTIMVQLNNKQPDFYPKHRTGSGTSEKRGFYRGALALGLVAGLLGACAQSTPQAQTPNGSTEVQPEKVANKTEDYIGQVVTVRSKPVEKVGDASFTISDEQLFGNNPILVINASGNTATLLEDDAEVQVTGEVRNLLVSDVNREFNLTLNSDDYQDYENQPVIIAQSIELAPKPGEISDNPEQYYGKTLAVTGKVTDLETGSAFTVEENRLLGSEDLLVIYATPKAGGQKPLTTTPPAAVTDGDTVAVTGVLRPFVLSDLKRDYNVTWNSELQQKLEEDYSNKPVLIATSVYQSTIPE